MSTKAVRQWMGSDRARGARRGSRALVILLSSAIAACGESETTGLPLPGSIQLTTETSGFNQDDGYELLVDGVSKGTIGANDQVTISDLDPSTHEVALADVAANCEVEAVSVPVVSEQTASVSLSVACSFAALTPWTLRFSRDRLNLDDGTFTDCPFGLCPSGEIEWDFYAHYNSQVTPHAVIRQNQQTAVQIAHVAGVTLAELTEEHVAAATFTTDLVPDSFDAGRVVLIQTNQGAVYALGNPVENTTTQTLALDAALVSAP